MSATNYDSHNLFACSQSNYLWSLHQWETPYEISTPTYNLNAMFTHSSSPAGHPVTSQPDDLEVHI